MITINNVSKVFHRNKVLDNINLTIKQNERIVLVGSNGAGKTTLIRCLLGEYTHDGSIIMDGMQPRKQRQAVLTRIGFVPQLPPPLKMTVGQLIHFAAAVCYSDVEKIYAVASALGFAAKLCNHQTFVKLSGGQKQKLLISIALGRDCKLLIMDEPTANLDPEARLSFFKLLAQRQHDTAMIVSSHRLDEVATLVNRVVELDQGKVVLDDQVVEQINMDGVLDCTIKLTQAGTAFTKTIADWHFTPGANECEWQGQVAGPDKARFLSMLSRYAGLLQEINMEAHK